MRSGVCPKCSAAAVHAARGNFSWGGEQGVRIATSPLVRGTRGRHLHLHPLRRLRALHRRPGQARRGREHLGTHHAGAGRRHASGLGWRHAGGVVRRYRRGVRTRESPGSPGPPWRRSAADGAPRTRILHPIWEDHVGWIATTSDSPKLRHLRHESRVEPDVLGPLSRTTCTSRRSRRSPTTRPTGTGSGICSSATDPPLGYDPGTFWPRHDRPRRSHCCASIRPGSS